MRWPLESTIDWLKLNPLRLNAMVLTPNEVNHIPITGQAARKKWSDRELLNEAYWVLTSHICMLDNYVYYKIYI